MFGLVFSNSFRPSSPNDDPLYPRRTAENAMEDTTPGVCATMQPQHLTPPERCYPHISYSQVIGAQEPNMHFSDFDIECFPGALSPALLS